MASNQRFHPSLPNSILQLRPPFSKSLSEMYIFPDLNQHVRVKVTRMLGANQPTIIATIPYSATIDDIEEAFSQSMESQYGAPNQTPQIMARVKTGNIIALDTVSCLDEIEELIIYDMSQIAHQSAPRVRSWQLPLEPGKQSNFHSSQEYRAKRIWAFRDTERQNETEKQIAMQPKREERKEKKRRKGRKEKKIPEWIRFTTGTGVWCCEPSHRSRKKKTCLQ